MDKFIVYSIKDQISELEERFKRSKVTTGSPQFEKQAKSC